MLDLRQITCRVNPFLLDGPGKTVVFLLIGFGELRNQIGVQQLFLEARKNAIFEVRAFDREAVVASAFVPLVGAAVIVYADLDDAASTASAGQHP